MTGVFAFDRNGTNGADSFTRHAQRSEPRYPVRGHHEARQRRNKAVGRGHLLLPMRRIG
jgi:hypothetical protein